MEASFQEYATIENPQAITEEPNEAKLQTLEVSHQNLIISSYQKKKYISIWDLSSTLSYILETTVSLALQPHFARAKEIQQTFLLSR